MGPNSMTFPALRFQRSPIKLVCSVITERFRHVLNVGGETSCEVGFILNGKEKKRP